MTRKKEEHLERSVFAWILTKTGKGPGVLKEVENFRSVVREKSGQFQARGRTWPNALITLRVSKEEERKRLIYAQTALL